MSFQAALEYVFRLSDYMGKVFEEICRQHLWELLLTGECPVEAG